MYGPAFQLTQASKPITAAELKNLGTKVASAWSDGTYCSLTEAAIGIIKNATSSMNTEQVKRVVEFANVDAYLGEFNKEAGHKFVDFGPEGPADPVEVIKELNRCGGEMRSDLSDYSSPPERVKESAASDFILERAFGTVGRRPSADIPEHNPFGEVVDLRDKLAGAYDHLTSQLSGLETIFTDLSEVLYGHVKQACLNGHTLGDVVSAWSTVSTDPVFVKAAFDQMTTRLIQEGVVDSLEEMGESLSKTAGARYVNQDHPLVHTYEDFCDALHKLAQVRQAREEVEDGYNTLTTFLVKAAGGKAGAFGKVKEVYKKHVIPGAGRVAEFFGMPGWVGKGAAIAVPGAAALGAGKYMYDTGKANLYGSGMMEHIPGTDPYQMRMQQIQAGMRYI